MAHVGRVDQIPFPQARSGSVRKDFAAQKRGDAFVRRRHKIVPFVSETEELIKPVPKRMIIRRAAEVPLPDQPRIISGPG